MDQENTWSNNPLPRTSSFLSFVLTIFLGCDIHIGLVEIDLYGYSRSYIQKSNDHSLGNEGIALVFICLAKRVCTYYY